MPAYSGMMTTKEFFAKHYGSLSAGVFGLGLVTLLGMYGQGFSATKKVPSQPGAQAQPAQPPVATGTPPTPGAPTETPKADTAAEKDPLEQAMAEEASKAAERRDAVRAEVNQQREEDGLPPLPAQEETVEAGGED